ncbi:MAG: DNA-binding response regulator, partial [Chloroflexota bacterium]
IIMLTQVGSPAERAMSLEEGADDYINKPFDPYELVARIRAVLRRALLGGRELPLTPKAVAVLDYLMTHPDEVISRERLLDAVWSWDYPTGTRAVDVRIAELRKTLGDDPTEPRYIETIPGQGYRFVGPVEAVP